MNDYEKFQNLVDKITTQAIEGKIPISVVRNLNQTFEIFKSSVTVGFLTGGN